MPVSVTSNALAGPPSPGEVVEVLQTEAVQEISQWNTLRNCPQG